MSRNDFQRAKLYAGTIVKVDDFLEAYKPVYKITVDFDHDTASTGPVCVS